MTVRKKLLSGFTGMIVLIVLLGTFVLMDLNTIGNHAKDIRNNSLPSLINLYTINDKVSDIQNLVLRSIVVQDDAEMQQINTEITEQQKIMIEAMKKYEPYLSDQQEIEWYNTFKENWNGYETVMSQIIQASELNNDVAAMQMQQDETARLELIESTLDQLVTHNAADVTAAADEQLTEFNTSRIIIWIAVGIAVLIGVGLALFISRLIVRPLKQMLGQVNYIAAGDLTRIDDLPVHQPDELGDLAKGLQQMGQSLHTVITEVNETSQRLNGSAEELTAIAEENAAAFTHTAESLVAMADVSTDQAARSEQGAVLVKDIAAHIQGIDQRINKVSESAQNAAEHSSSGAVIVSEAAQQMEAAQMQLNEMSAVVSELQTRSQEIGSIVGIITGIAGQTNLLALNAAIEAARAGEHGKGFAVVASEVQKLAEQSSSSAGRIVEMIASIQQDTERLQQSMDATTHQIYSGAESMRSTGMLFGNIQQSVNEVADQSNEAARASGAVSQSAVVVSQSINGIVQSVEHSSEEIQKISASSEQQTASMGELSSSAVALSGMAEEMSQIVERFKL